jgi:NAD(P)-dependent dehydrogenase (short-subunit alcohol dehydrogenase family)
MRTFQVNVLGAVLCCRAVLPMMLQQNRGKIINLTGGGVGLVSGTAYRTAYHASKAAIIRLTEDLPLELAGKNIQVNVMEPGSHRTRMVEEMLAGVAAADVAERFEETRRLLRLADEHEKSSEQRRKSLSPVDGRHRISLAGPLAGLAKVDLGHE